ncbi:DNA-protecting protein DprA [Waterburya agarophytonicola K14]|uniref:DNA-protecting protein DprA n=1 Tax=Waterburya agarophytonicola KI4 TaxID=2874699 RepID=A0A964FFV4_9CYAN|nr:DNA-processing protein DprA [Waterburya agarophytonicola]MCC0177311.1 DNA-protecting protein DprA [Waterburya agarophytonicola KI4]
MEQERAYWLAWSQISGIGAISLKKIYQHFGSLQQAWHAEAIAFAEIEGLGGKVAMAIQQKRNKIDPEALLSRYLEQNPLFWTPTDPEYPRLLLEIPGPPPLLYYSGRVESKENSGITPMIGIVGTRNPTEYGKRWTKKITQALVQHGFGIVSGMAAGIDTIAHHSCLSAQGRTIAVLGTGVDTVYPHSNRTLHQRLQNEGLIISEYPSQTPPDRGHFPARNRIIAGLCRGVIIIEAPKRSGALITARFANEFGRDVYVLPGSLDNTQSLGCLTLLNSGAHIILGIEELLEMLGTMPCLDLVAPQAKVAPQLEPNLESIYRLIDEKSISLDTIVEQTGKNTGEVLAALSQLELMDLIVQLPGMRYQISGS